MFLQSLIQMGGFELNHHWHGINVLSLLECCLLAACLCTGLALFARYVRKSRRLTILSLIGALSFATAAYAANTALSALSASGALAGADLIYVVQTAGVGGVKGTMTKVATFINSLFSGDFTVTSGGVATLKNTGPGATGPIGSATVAPVVTIDAQGRVTALTSAGITQPVAANPSATAGPAAVNGAASTFMRSDGAPAVQQGSSSQKGIVQVDGTTITAASGVISTTPLTVTTSVQTGTNYAFLTGDQAKVVYLSNASNQIPTIALAGSAGFTTGWFVSACNIAAGTQTITPASGTIGGAATYLLPPGSALSPRCITFISDGTGTNYAVFPAGNTYTIASGTSALGTSAIGSAACATVVTTAGVGILTTDTVTASFNGDPTAVTGYVPLTAGMLTIIAYPTAGNVNFKVCNNTSSSITPGAITLNWRVVR